ncbi:MAG TPA: sulfate adenylyltransferase subunit CysN [Planctomycetota bacterium]|nr:sulfate adenylyltransferase subunit CysN [Planctomycetota bacterium]
MSHQDDLIQKDILSYLAQHERKDLLRFLTCGNVDDGKSTLIGRLLHDSKMIYEDTLAAIKKDSKKFNTTGGEEMDLALLVDGLEAERQQGITIDVAYRFFSTAKRKFIIADTPGHEQYTRNMATGASTCDLAIILIDARNGVQTQTRRHTFIASLLGIRHIVVAINKMDVVDFREGVFEKIREDYENFAERLELPDVHFIPISALKGDNVVHPSKNMPWYGGSTLMHLLEHVPIGSDRNLTDLRFPVQFVFRPNLDFRGFQGTVSSGILRKGEEVVVLPSRKTNRVKSIVTFEGGLEEAFAGQAVTLALEKEVDISRGDMLVRPGNLPQVGEHLEAMVVWMTEEPMRLEKQYRLKHTTKVVNASVPEIRYRVNINNLEHEPARRLELNEIGHCVIALTEPIAFDPYPKNRATGAFILIDRLTNNTVGAGMILDRETEAADQGLRELVELDLRRYARRGAGGVSPEDRARRLGQGPVVILLTGLMGSGKSTLARALEKRLFDQGRAVHVLDGSNAGLHEGSDPEFSSDRSMALLEVARQARLLGDAGLISIVAFSTPLESDRQAMRRIAGAERTVEIYLSAPMGECRRRDPAGLYARADAGQLKHVPGVNDPYEPPVRPDLILPTHELPVDPCVDRIVEVLSNRGFIPKSQGGSP